MSEKATRNEGENRRGVPVNMKREEELIAAGWERRFIACEPRLSEMADMYKEIGFDILLEPLHPKEEMDAQSCEANGCTACFDVDRERYKIIYTRKVAN